MGFYKTFFHGLGAVAEIVIENNLNFWFPHFHSKQTIPCHSDFP